MGNITTRKRSDFGLLVGETLQYSHHITKFEFTEKWKTLLFPENRGGFDLLFLEIFLFFSSTSQVDLSFEIEYRRPDPKTKIGLECKDKIRRRFSCTYEIRDNLLFLTEIEETLIKFLNFPSKIQACIYGYLLPSSDENNLINCADVILLNLLKKGFIFTENDGLKWNSQLEEMIMAKNEKINFQITNKKMKNYIEWNSEIRNLAANDSNKKKLEKEKIEQEEEENEDQLPAPIVRAQTDGLLITVDLPPKARRLTLRIAKFGFKFQTYDWKTGTLLDKEGASIPLYGARQISVKAKLESSTRYSVKYSVLVGDQWSKRSKDEQAFTCHSLEKPPAPELEPIPCGFRVYLPKLPPNAQHLTLWVLQQGWEEYQVFDWKTRKVVPQEGSAVPVWDTGKSLEVILEPDQRYTIRYSLMQNDLWQGSSESATATTKPKRENFKLF